MHHKTDKDSRTDVYIAIPPPDAAGGFAPHVTIDYTRDHLGWDSIPPPEGNSCCYVRVRYANIGARAFDPAPVNVADDDEP